MKDLENPEWIKAKGILFLFVGLAAAILLLVENPSLKAGILLAVAIWSFCRAYYFAFYVIEHYVDPGYRFSGLGSFIKYMMKPSTNPAPPTSKRSD
jgi:hypothetical protein